MVDQNLAAAHYSIISVLVLPHVLNLDTTTTIWSTLIKWLQATNRSRVIQLKNELHHLSLKNSTMTQYLSEVKTIVDRISAARSNVDAKDIILYLLNGLPTIYQSFKSAIRTCADPISLDELYSLLLIEEVNLATEAARDVSTPTSAKQVTSSDSDKPFDQPSHYRHLVGSLQYLTLTRLDIAYAFYQVSQHMHSPIVASFQALKQIFRYLQDTPTLGLPIIAAPLHLSTYTDSDWASDSLTRHSTTGYCHFLGTNVIAWRVHKHPTVVYSTPKSRIVPLPLRQPTSFGFVIYSPNSKQYNLIRHRSSAKNFCICDGNKSTFSCPHEAHRDQSAFCL